MSEKITQYMYIILTKIDTLYNYEMGFTKDDICQKKK